MNNLKQYAGLLNDEAPENHFLAYITPSERDMLVEAGGVKTPTSSGIFAYPPDNDARGQSTGSSSSSNSGGGGRDTGSDYGQFDRAVSQAANNPSPTPSGGDNNYPDRIQRISSGVEPGYTSTSSQPFGVSPEQAYQEGKITVDEYRQAQQVQDNAALDDPNLIEKAFDLYKQYGIIPNALKLGGSLLDKIGGVSKDFQNKIIAFDLQNKLEKAYQSPTFDPFSPDASVTQLEQDLARAKAGEYSQQEYQNTYAPQMNQTDQGGSERDAINALTPYAPYAISGKTPQPSMVNEYFNNLNNTNLGISENYLNTYNTAKTKMANTLNITPNTNQYGYGNSYNDNYSRSMNSSNVFYNYLNEQGLI